MSLMKWFVFYFIQESGNSTIAGITFFVSDTFGEALYSSCKDVKFGSMNTRAIDFVGGGARDHKGECLPFFKQALLTSSLYKLYF
jgi:hypothetical protein